MNPIFNTQQKKGNVLRDLRNSNVKDGPNPMADLKSPLRSAMNKPSAPPNLLSKDDNQSNFNMTPSFKNPMST
jgi:hypothetical protein